jgi:uracil-DNA glycosylase
MVDVKQGVIVGSKEDLNRVYEQYKADRRLEHLRRPGINFVPGMGPLKPALMLIGEAPGRLENAKHLPFVGQAGIALSNLLEDVGTD